MLAVIQTDEKSAVARLSGGSGQCFDQFAPKQLTGCAANISAAQIATSSSTSERDVRRPRFISPDTPLAQCPKAVMSASLGRHASAHSLDAKVAALQELGYDGIEIHMDCLKNETRRHFRLAPEAMPTDAQLLVGARRVKEKCDNAGLNVICLEPFLHYPGLPLEKRQERLKEVHLWFAIADNLGTDMIQIASAMFGGDEISTDHDRIVEDLTILADMGLRRPRVKYWAYEAMCFGHGTVTWEEAFAQVKAVNRPNFGMVFDTFQILGAAYADPSAIDGKRADADEAVERTLANIKETFSSSANRAKVFFVQLGDACRPEEPLSIHHPLYDAKTHANLKMTWARNYRAFPGEGYLPTLRAAEIFLVECGWRGWISAEVFEREASEDDASYPLQAAQRCKAGQESFLVELSQ